MNNREKIEFKNFLKSKCVSIITERIEAVTHLIQNAQEAANNEEKSSAGDKYETGRAMSHLEKEMHTSQLIVNKKELTILLTVNCDRLNSIPIPGSIVDCGSILFFIAAGLGKIIFESKPIFLLSPLSPLAVVLKGKSTGDEIVFKNSLLMIKEIY